MQILRLIFRFCSERESFLFPTGAEVTKACLSSTLLGSTTVNRLANLGTHRILYFPIRSHRNQIFLV